MGNRFVIQEHTTAGGVHWDFMLERGEVLVTFRLEEPPANVPDHPVRAVRIFDHPLRFLTYEGPVQKGAGRVRIVERGACRLLDESEDAIVLDLQGSILAGAFVLTRTLDQTWELARRPETDGIR